MRNQNKLTKELVKYMLAIFGLADYVEFDTIGIIKNEFKTDFNIKIQYENDKIEKYPIYSGSTTFNGSKLKVVGCRVADNDGDYYAALFKLDDLFTYGIKINMSDDTENVIFLVSKIEGSWTKLNMYDKIIACAGLEKLNDAGIIWKQEDIGNFYNILIELIEM